MSQSAARQLPPQTVEEIIAGRVVEIVLTYLAERRNEQAGPRAHPSETAPADHYGWEIQFWSVPPETEVGMAEAAKGLGVSKSWLYARTSAQCPPDDRIPHSKGADNSNRFLVGDVRDWWRAQQRVVVPGRSAREAFERRHGPLNIEK